jgi:hypothetical protein
MMGKIPEPQTETRPPVDQDRSQDGATSLEWALLVGGVALLCYPILYAALSALVGYYRLMTTLNALPFP